ncbi:MAG: thioredoxin [Candidatus Obscuribacterales bacterium]|nr:thioredoxin [Candidatus Obscuribacterales bacterium]
MIKDMVIAFLVCIIIGAMLNGGLFGASAPPTPAPTPTTEQSTTDPGNTEASSTAAPETSDANFDQDVLQSQLPVLVDFSAPWCAPCREMGPIVDQLAHDYEGKVKVYKVDTDQNPLLKEKYQIQAWPTFMLFKDGKQQGQYTGAMPKDSLASVIDNQFQTR